jgi:hypothetical protein
MTSHASQGQTVHRVFIHHNVDAGKHGQREMYVNITRDREEARIYHNDLERTIKQITVASSKTTAHDTNSRIQVEPQIKPGTAQSVTKLTDNSVVSSSDKGLKNGNATEVLKRLVSSSQIGKSEDKTTSTKMEGVKSKSDSSSTKATSKPSSSSSEPKDASRGADAGR